MKIVLRLPIRSIIQPVRMERNEYAHRDTLWAVPTNERDQSNSDDIAGKKADRLYLAIGPMLPTTTSAASTNQP
jgi:hypothetical protein